MGSRDGSVARRRRIRGGDAEARSRSLSHRSPLWTLCGECSRYVVVRCSRRQTNATRQIDTLTRTTSALTSLQTLKMKSMIGSHAANTATKDCTRLVDISRSEKRTCDAFSSEPAAVCESHRVGQLPCVHHDSPTWPCRQDHNYVRALVHMAAIASRRDHLRREHSDGRIFTLHSRRLSRRTLRKVAKEDSLVAAARLAVRMNASDQLWLEFGAHSGTTARALGELHQLIAPDKPIYSFDSFRGLPETWRPQPPRGASEDEDAAL